MSGEKNVEFPVGAADEQALTANGAQAITITNMLTKLDGVTVVMVSSARTINLTITSGIRVGAKIIVISKSNGTENNVFGTSMTGPTVAGVNGKTHTFTFIYDGTNFVQQGLSVQLD